MRLSGVVLLLALAISGRAKGQDIAFENATIDIVRVYLVDHGSVWLLGRADPGRVTHLKLPPGITARSSDRISLVAVPIGAPGGRMGSVQSTQEPSVFEMRSEPEPAENLWRMRWKLAGHQLFSVPGF